MGDLKDSIYGNNPNTRKYVDSLYRGDGFTEEKVKFVSSYSEDSGRPQKKEKKKNRKGMIALLICGCVVISGLLGFAGAAIYDGIAGDGGGNNITRTDGYTLEDATGSSLTVSEIVNKTADSVVEIMTESVVTDSWMMQYVTEGAGSGVIVDSKGYIVTNYHVVQGASKIYVTLYNEEEYEAEIIGSDSVNDIAVIKINPKKELTAAVYGNSDQLVVGELAVAIGNPLGELGGTVTAGIISALDREINVDGKPMNLLQTDASINPGNSGGGLFNQYGQLIGVVVAKSSGSDIEGLGFAIPINAAAQSITDIISSGGNIAGKSQAGSAKIGLNLIDVTDEYIARQYGVNKLGLYVAEISSLNAQQAGFQIGDRIVKADGKKISEFDGLEKVLAKHSPGDTLEVVVERDDGRHTLKTVLISEAEMKQ